MSKVILTMTPSETDFKEFRDLTVPGTQLIRVLTNTYAHVR